jgi:hypothetical protein
MRYRCNLPTTPPPPAQRLILNTVHLATFNFNVFFNSMGVIFITMATGQIFVSV